MVNNAGEGVSLAGMSKLMAGLMAGAPGQGGSAVFTTEAEAGSVSSAGADRQWPDAARQSGGEASGAAEPSGTGRQGKRGARLRYLDDPFHDALDGKAVLVQRFELLDIGDQAVRARLAVALSGALGREGEPPKGASVPTVLGWRSETGEVLTVPELHVAGGDGRIWSLVVRPAPDTVTEIAVTSERKDGSG